MNDQELLTRMAAGKSMYEEAVWKYVQELQAGIDHQRRYVIQYKEELEEAIDSVASLQSENNKLRDENKELLKNIELLELDIEDLQDDRRTLRRELQWEQDRNYQDPELY